MSEEEMRYTHIIWDFNGTLFDDVEAGILSVNEMLQKRGLDVISDKDEYRKIFKFPIIEYYRELGFDFDAEPYEVLAPIWVELYNKYSLESKLQRDALNALEYFKALQISQILISATHLEMLKGQTDRLGISQYFDDILGLSNIEAYSKEELVQKWKEENPDSNPLFIGDTEHDADVAAAIGADCFLVCNGHQSRERLQRCARCVVCDNLFHMGMAFQLANFR